MRPWTATGRAQAALKLQRSREADAKNEAERVKALEAERDYVVNETRLRYQVEIILGEDQRYVKVEIGPDGQPRAFVDGVEFALVSGNLYAPGVHRYVYRLEDFATLLEALHTDESEAAS